MDYGRLLARAGYLVWHHKFLWMFGFFMSIGGSVWSLLRLVAGPTLLPRLRQVDIEQLLLRPESVLTAWGWGAEQMGAWLIGGVVGLFALSLVGWVIVTLAEGSVIGATLALEQKRPVTPGYALLHAWQWLGRFIAIDAIVFFPLFIVMFIILLLMMGALVATGALAVTGAAQEALLLVGVGLLCLAPLLCLLPLMGIATAAFRALAFRETAVCSTAVRAVVGNTWRVIRPRLFTVLVLFLLLWGAQYLLETALNVLSLPLFTLAATTRSWALFLGLLVWVPTTLVRAIVYAFVATAWTLAYREWAACA